MRAGDDYTAQQFPIGSFTVEVLKRILTVLSEQGKTKRTNLAGKTGLNYMVCVRYINFMKTLSWIELVSDEEENEYISITPIGRRIGSALSDFLDGRDTQAVDYSTLDATIVRHSAVGDNETLELLPEVGLESGPVKKVQRAHGKAAKILLIDDEPDVALTYKSFLTSEGYTVDAFREPEKAVEHFIASRPMYYDLVITDIRMREMNGLRLFQCLKSIDPAIKVIFVTALDAAEELVSVVSPGPVQILKKPIDKQVFSRSVKAALQSS